jgi:hypothetical protein
MHSLKLGAGISNGDAEVLYYLQSHWLNFLYDVLGYVLLINYIDLDCQNIQNAFDRVLYYGHVDGNFQ